MAGRRLLLDLVYILGMVLLCIFCVICVLVGRVCCVSALMLYYRRLLLDLQLDHVLLLQVHRRLLFIHLLLVQEASVVI